MKKTLLSFVCAAVTLMSIAQPLKSSSQTSAFADALNKVVTDFRNNFLTIQGSKMPAEVDAETYQSKICLPGALGCKIMRYHSVEDKSASWQAGIYSGDKYDEGLKQYKKIFSQVKNTKVKGPDAAGNSFEGQLEKTDENVRFAVSSLRLKTNDKFYKNLVAEVELISNYSGWEVHLNIYTKKITAKEDTEEDNTQ